ncbi:hypothetical protein ACHWQZ_G016563 [Mnemiopsis leidyi]
MSNVKAVQNQSKIGRSMVNKSRAGGAFGRSMIGGKSVMSSRTNVSSRRSAGLDKPINKPTQTVYDEDGNDVTPAPLVQVENALNKGPSKGSVGGDQSADGTQSASVFGQSVFIGGQSFAAPFSRTGMDIGMSGSSYMQGDDDIGDDTTAYGGISHIHREHTHVAEILNEEQLEEQVKIVLTETPTIFLLDLRGTAVASDAPDYDEVKAKNETYAELLKNRAGNDSYIPRGMQTLNNPSKQKQVQTQPVGDKDTGVMATSWDMYDTYKALEEASKGDGDGDNDEDDILGEVMKPNKGAAKAVDARGVQNGAVALGESTSTGNESSRLSVSVLTESSVALDDKQPAQGNSAKSQEQSAEDEKRTADHILNSPSLQANLCIMERVVTRNIYQGKQALYRNMKILPDPDSGDNKEEADLSVLGPNVERLWTYGGVLTKSHNISCMTWNKKNHDILAVGYGEYGFTNQKSGMACCWSIKNPEYPERVFKTSSGITALDFSLQNPNLLAVGMYNGTIAVYNVRFSSQLAILDSNETPSNHLGPVWEIKWIEREYHAGEERSENIITSSTDGKVTQWMIRKGFESVDLMKLKRIGKKTTPEQQQAQPPQGEGEAAKAGQKLRGEAFISRFAGGLGFDFYPSNNNIYLVATEEGFIHKCSCSYNEQYLQTYTGHTGPVYKVKWSPFVPDCFLTCGADWTIRLWHTDLTKPVLTFVSSTKSVNDVCWSNVCATVFGAVSDNRIEIWDLRTTNLDPVIISSVSDPETRLSTFLFSEGSSTLLVGDSSGHVTVYQLRNIAEPSTTHIQTLRDIVLPMPSSQSITLSSTSITSSPPDR